MADDTNAVAEVATATPDAPNSQDQQFNDFSDAFDTVDVAPIKKDEVSDEDQENSPTETTAKKTEVDTGKEKESEEDGDKPAEESAEKLKADADHVEAGRTFWKNLERLHPGASKKAESEEFKSWLKNQTSVIQRAATRDDIEDASDILEAFDKAQNAVPEKVESAPTKAEVNTAVNASIDSMLGVKFQTPDGEKTLADIRQDYGELFDGIYAMMQAQMAATLAAIPKQDYKSEIDGLRKNVGEIEVMKKQLDAFSFKAAVSDVHPDYQTIISSKEFDTWKNSQPSKIQYLLDNGSAEDVAKMIGFYKDDQKAADVSKVESKNSSKKKTIDAIDAGSLRKNNNRTPTSGSRSNVSLSDFEDEFNKVS